MTLQIESAEALREKWGVIELEPGLRLWFRAMLPFVTWSETPVKKQELKIATTAVVEAEDRFKGSAGSAFPGDSGEPERVYDSPKVVTPCESLFRLPNGAMVSLRVTPIRARRYHAFTSDGDPVVQIETTIQVLPLSGEGVPSPTSLELGHTSPKTSAPSQGSLGSLHEQ